MESRVQRTAGQVATTLIREKILSGDLPPGAELNQNELAAALGMSRIPIRDALRSLGGEGLIVLRAHSTATVAPLSIADLQELYDIRVAIEPKLSRQALDHMDGEEVDALRSALEHLEGADDRSWSSANVAFHRAIYTNAPKPRTIEIIDRAREATDRYVRMYHQLDRATDREEHRQIYDAVVARQGRRLEALITAHLSAGYETMLAYLQELSPDAT